MNPPKQPSRDQYVAPRDPRQRLRSGQLGGLLLLAGAVVSVPTGVVFADEGLTQLLSTPLLAALVAGVVCLLTPWQRLGEKWLHLLPLTAAAILLAAIVGGGERGGAVYSPLYFTLGAYVAYAFHSRWAVGAHLAVICGCSAAPLLYAGAALGESVAQTLLRTFALATTTALMAMVRERMQAGQEALRELAQTDPLTGVGNYRKLYHRLAYEIRRHQRSGQPLALLVMDLDGFKSVNDRNGHLAGDRLLQQVGKTLSETVRAQDTVARQGGDEFAILAPETGASAAAALANRIENALGRIDADGVVVGVSVGWAVYPQDGEERMVLLENADARQRAMKRTRRASVSVGLQARLSA
ncbi:MAG: GGDEF domain-containing protein [Actinomycetota bacterium]|nr:GGDEF domain-containing protein [Actinomycetota bacterium]